jgi:hypothetical protein
MTDAQAATAQEAANQIRILSLDGGGIYGMTGALWLRQLCERDRDFLSGRDVDIFLGCSSGACNALLLAMHERPREAVLDGLLERFWAEPGTFSNTNPMGALLSFTGQVGWFGEADFRGQLGRYMGNRRLKDLKHKVLISTYDWHGRTRYPDLRDGDGRPRSEPSWDRWNELWRQAVGAWASGWGGPVPAGLGYADGGDGAGWYQGPGPSRADWADENDRHWQPKFFNNLRDDAEDGDYLVAEIAYGAATPPGFRAMRGGLGDGASFSANPSVHGISAVLDHYRREQLERAAHHGEDFANAYREVYEAECDTYGTNHRDERGKILHQHDRRTSDLLSRIRMLSLGDGTRQPYFWQPDSNYGFRSWGNIPANPWRGHWHGPGSYALQAADEEAAGIARDLLGRRYYRLNPGINDLPTVLAAYFARWPHLRAWMLDQIRSAAMDRTSRDAVDKAARFLRSPNWTEQPEDWVKRRKDELARLQSELDAAEAALGRPDSDQPRP